MTVNQYLLAENASKHVPSSQTAISFLHRSLKWIVISIDNDEIRLHLLKFAAFCFSEDKRCSMASTYN